MITPEQYYTDSDNHGSYQYESLKDIVNNFIVNFTGDTSLIGQVKRFNVVYHAKRGIQELSYDALKDVSVLEVELSDSYELILPHDYISYVRISWLDENGKFHPMSMDNRASIAKAYLQDHEYNIMFDESGNPLEGDSIQKERRFNQQTPNLSTDNYINTNGYVSILNYQRYDHDTTVNSNGTFNIDQRRGTIQFGTNIGSKVIILEYISDGLSSSDEANIVIHKFAIEALNAYIKWMFLTNRINVQEYVVNRAKKEYYNARRLAKSRLAGIRLNELILLLNGKSKWIKN